MLYPKRKQNCYFVNLALQTAVLLSANVELKMTLHEQVCYRGTLQQQSLKTQVFQKSATVDYIGFLCGFSVCRAITKSSRKIWLIKLAEFFV